MTGTQGERERVLSIEPLVRRVFAGRVPHSAVDDLVQETLGRLAEPAARLTPDELQAYATTSARNAAASFHRTARRHRRIEPRMIDLTQPADPAVVAVRAEEAGAVHQAWERLDPEDRNLLHAHHIDEDSVDVIAQGAGRSEMAIRMQLSRARARLRVDYTLAHGNVELPSMRCRPVLLALSSGDRRAQARLDTIGHLERCEVCSELVAPATGQRRPALALLPMIGWLWTSRPAVRRTVSVSVAAVSAFGAAIVLVLVAHAHDTGSAATKPTAARAPASSAVPTTGVKAATPPSLPPTGRVVVGSGPLAATPAALGQAAGQTVTAKDVVVLEVPANEGFWVAADGGGRLWVQLVGRGGESPVQVRAGATVSFTGRVVDHDAQFADAVGVTPPEGAGDLSMQRHHLEVPTAALRVR